MSAEHYDLTPGTQGPSAEGREPGEGGEPPHHRPGLPWERRGDLGPGPAILQTIRDIVVRPAAAFRDMHTGGGWSEPLGFAVLIGSIGVWVAQAWDILTRSMLAGTAGMDPVEIASANAQELWFALFAPFLVCAATFFGAGFIHVLLMLFGGAPRPYETTFRVVCYSWALGVFNAIPICGVVVGAVWRVVVQIIGLREAHEVPTGRAAAAVLIPVLLACFCLVLLTIASLGMANLMQLGF